MNHNKTIQNYLSFYNHFEGFNGHNGIRITEVREGYCKCEAALTAQSLNPQGSAHGGLIFTLCDVAAGIAAMTTGNRVLTLDASVSYLRVGRGSKLFAVGTCLKAGKTVCFCEAEVYDEDAALIAKGSLNMFRTEMSLEQFLKDLQEQQR